MSKRNAYYEKYLELKKLYLNMKYQLGGITQFQIMTDSFENKELMNVKYTKYGANEIPNIWWTGVPKGTDNLLLLCYDEEAIPVAGKVWIHWFVYNIDSSTSKLVKGHYEEGCNSFEKNNYGGPRPPKNTGIHKYRFKLFALNEKIMFEKKCYEYEDIIKRIKGKVVKTTEIIGLYERV